jgi:hypothetical protein
MVMMMMMEKLSTDAFQWYLVHITRCAFVQSCDHHYHVQVVKLSDELECLLLSLALLPYAAMALE